MGSERGVWVQTDFKVQSLSEARVIPCVGLRSSRAGNEFRAPIQSWSAGLALPSSPPFSFSISTHSPSCLRHCRFQKPMVHGRGWHATKQICATHAPPPQVFEGQIFTTFAEFCASLTSQAETARAAPLSVSFRSRLLLSGSCIRRFCPSP